MIIGFNTVPDSAARQAAERANVDIRFFDLIYKLLDDTKDLLAGALDPEERERIAGFVVNRFRGDRALLEPPRQLHGRGDQPGLVLGPRRLRHLHETSASGTTRSAATSPDPPTRR